MKTQKKRTATAHWPLSSLMRSLSQVGWGTLTDEVPGVRLVLRGLTDRLNDLDARGKVTQYQLQECTGLSARWIRTCLNRLEDLGIIRWWRGGFMNGTPMPSFIEVKKKKLVELIDAARMTIQERRQANKDARNARMAALRRPNAIVEAPRKTVPDLTENTHAEVTTALRPLTGDSPQGKSHCETDLFTCTPAKVKKESATRSDLIEIKLSRAERMRASAPYLDQIKKKLGMRR
ncbi:hypothetical protein [Arcanobacterium haemolyticum]